MKRFIIDKLVVTGTNVKPAVLSFNLGTNLIIGSSDTGKSYIFPINRKGLSIMWNYYDGGTPKLFVE